MCNQKLNLSAPWETFRRQVEALFGQDPDIKIDYDPDKPTLNLYVNGDRKAEAISKLLPPQEVFGNVVLTIAVIPANPEEQDIARTLEDAFTGNPVFDQVVAVRPDGCSNPFVYALFKNEVVQYWNDDLSDANGIVSTLYQDIAREVIGEPDGVYYCTTPGDNIIRSAKK